MMNRINNVFSTKDIMMILDISESTAYKLIRQAMTNENMFVVKKIGRDYKIPREPFLNWLESK